MKNILLYSVLAFIGYFQLAFADSAGLKPLANTQGGKKIISLYFGKVAIPSFYCHYSDKITSTKSDINLRYGGMASPAISSPLSACPTGYTTAATATLGETFITMQIQDVSANFPYNGQYDTVEVIISCILPKGGTDPGAISNFPVTVKIFCEKK